MAVTYEPLSFTSDALELTTSTELFLRLAPEFDFQIKVGLGSYGYEDDPFELSVSLLVPISMEVAVEVNDGNTDVSSAAGCATTYASAARTFL